MVLKRFMGTPPGNGARRCPAPAPVGGADLSICQVRHHAKNRWRNHVYRYTCADCVDNCISSCYTALWQKMAVKPCGVGANWADVAGLFIFGGGMYGAY